MSTKATGYAIVTDAGIDVSTVSPTEVGAKVNWLATARKVMMPVIHTDTDIDRIFERFAAASEDHPRIAIVRIKAE